VKGKVLVVEDDQGMRQLILRILEQEKYQVRGAADGQEGLEAFFSWQPDLVVLDVMLPQMDGLTLLERIREVSEAAVILLTALGREHQKVRGLRSGADDYVSKPFSVPELVARVEAVLRRVKEAPKLEAAYEDQVLLVDFLRHKVQLRRQAVELSPTEFRLLTALVKNAGAVMSAERLLDLVWGEAEVGHENVRVYVSSLRKKLGGGSGQPQLIETVREFGYRYNPHRE
jgi:DNA-binding response OmpR family regulator